MDNIGVGTGSLSIQAGGAIGQNAGATLTQQAGAGTASFNAGAGAITLTNAGRRADRRSGTDHDQLGNPE
ncbi:MAG: hypothetical protein WDO24_06730 [Pseudomonadota bacterium]